MRDRRKIIWKWFISKNNERKWFRFNLRLRQSCWNYIYISRIVSVWRTIYEHEAHNRIFSAQILCEYTRISAKPPPPIPVIRFCEAQNHDCPVAVKIKLKRALIHIRNFPFLFSSNIVQVCATNAIILRPHKSVLP